MVGFASKRMMVMDKLEVKEFDQRHGGAYDRGGADAYYGRAFQPHYFTGRTNMSLRIELTEADGEDYEAYAAGYRDAVEAGHFKDWG